MSDERELRLEGGFSHPGKVVRVGDTVRRPSNENAPGIGALLLHVAGTGCLDVPVPRGTDERGREVFSYVEGEVPVPPYPPWAVTDRALEGIGTLLRGYHDAAADFVPGPRARWASDLADPRGGPIVCHNDVCLENVVFRDGAPVGLLDFDLAAPGRPVYDIAMTLRLCGPVRHPRSRQPSFGDVDPLARVAAFCRGYGLDGHSARALPDALVDACRVAARFVAGRAAAGMAWFTDIWAAGGAERYAADEAWVVAHADAIRAAATPA